MVRCVNAVFGTAPCPLTVLPAAKVMAGAQAANIMDNKPIVNLAGFGMCSSAANPTVAAATAAALGILTPRPCIPATSKPWAGGDPAVLIGGQSALNRGSQLICNWGGVISSVAPA